jgi:cobalamin synthase
MPEKSQGSRNKGKSSGTFGIFVLLFLLIWFLYWLYNFIQQHWLILTLIGTIVWLIAIGATTQNDNTKPTPGNDTHSVDTPSV